MCTHVCGLPCRGSGLLCRCARRDHLRQHPRRDPLRPGLHLHSGCDDWASPTRSVSAHMCGTLRAGVRLSPYLCLAACQTTDAHSSVCGWASMREFSMCGRVIVVAESVCVCVCVRAPLACVVLCVCVCTPLCMSVEVCVCVCVTVPMCRCVCTSPGAATSDSCRASREQPPHPPHCCLLSSFATKGSPGGR